MAELTRSELNALIVRLQAMFVDERALLELDALWRLALRGLEESAAHEARDRQLRTLEGQAGTPAASPAPADLVKRLRLRPAHEPKYRYGIVCVGLDQTLQEAAELIERLVRERDEANDAYIGAKGVADGALDALKQWQENAQAVERDAARYQWLRQFQWINSDDVVKHYPVWGPGTAYPTWQDATDAAIDAAMRK